jgi:hypothetical protein
MNDDWTPQEIEVILADYFFMLNEEIEGRPFNKSAQRRSILPLLSNRNHGSIERKRQNVSAALASMGIPYINGYKPLTHYQKKLDKLIADYLSSHPSVEASFRRFSELPNNVTEHPFQFETILESAPEKQMRVAEPNVGYRNPIKLNYLEMEQANRVIGNAGEKIVLDYERWRLISKGKEALAEKIEWVAQTQGDGLGFDILSKNENGSDRYIEVKSTKLTKESPIFFSKNEYEFSIHNAPNYHLYRVFKLNEAAKLFIVSGRFNDFCNFEPVKFKGYF